MEISGEEQGNTWLGKGAYVAIYFGKKVEFKRPSEEKTRIYKEARTRREE